jgi:hypothetical protein
MQHQQQEPEAVAHQQHLVVQVEADLVELLEQQTLEAVVVETKMEVTEEMVDLVL